ncbi:MAG TPA: TauD/TfdA family dioxygenase [Streptosporangiaceae bacterium]|jgi:gamma-butyrobetaine dioxygenase
MKHLVDPQTTSIGCLPAAWLRDNCPCADCRDPVSGQRLIAITDLAPQLSVTATAEEADGLRITFGPDGHQAVFSREWLASLTAPAVAGRSEDIRQLWRAADFPAGPPSVTWADYEASDATRLTCLRQLLATGFMLLRGVPPRADAVLSVAGSFGYVRETNYGRLFDVRVEATPANLAFTGLPIGPHTDNPYRDPSPTVQLLHCLVNAADGGESGLLDGYTAAATLRAEDPAAFDCLTTTPVTFRYADAGAELTATRPMIGLTATGLISEIRYNSRSLQPPAPGPDASAVAQLTELYRAYGAFALILLRPELTLRFSLEPGDCIVFDNTRLMHSRTGFSAAGQRHLQGCYADLDGVESTVAVLARGGAQ